MCSVCAYAHTVDNEDAREDRRVNKEGEKGRVDREMLTDGLVLNRNAEQDKKERRKNYETKYIVSTLW